MVAVRIYIEGGGDDNNTKGRCREGFVRFFGKLLKDCGKPHVVACGGRNAAFNAWKQALRDHSDAVCLLLVDSEAPIAEGDGPWTHLRKRDRWSRPSGAQDGHCHLMAQCMEAWFIADRTALASFYDGGFKDNKLPKQIHVEKIPKKDLFDKLADATTTTKKKGAYGKGTHGFELMGLIDPAKVEAASPQMARLARVLRQTLCPKSAQAAPSSNSPSKQSTKAKPAKKSAKQKSGKKSTNQKSGKKMFS